VLLALELGECMFYVLMVYFIHIFKMFTFLRSEYRGRGKALGRAFNAGSNFKEPKLKFQSFFT
jgi:hypothetical protein